VLSDRKTRSIEVLRIKVSNGRDDCES
jgi:hypothetical protein